MPHWMRLVAWRMANWKNKKNAFMDKGIPSPVTTESAASAEVASVSLCVLSGSVISN